MTKLCFSRFISLFTILLISSEAFCLEGAQTLPKGVNYFKFTVSSLDGIEERYNSGGLLEGVTAKYHVNLNSATLQRLNPQIDELISALNTQVPRVQQFGDRLSLGTVNFSANPQAHYYVPVFARGITDKFTLGFGVPIVTVRTNVTVEHGGVNNIASMRQALASLRDPTLDSYLAQLQAIDPVKEFHSKLAASEYSPQRNYDDTSLGDLTLTGIYQYYSRPFLDLAVRPYIILPTGRRDDPDDVFDIPTGGQTAVGVMSIHDLKLSKKFTWGTSLGYKASIPDRREVRVPRDEFDFLPGVERKEELARQLGNEWLAETNIRFKVSRPLAVELYYEAMTKSQDRYGGTRNYNYSLLERDSDVETHTLRTIFTFSTVDWFMGQEASVPFELSYSYVDTFQAKNYPNAKMNQIIVKAFF